MNQVGTKVISSSSSSSPPDTSQTPPHIHIHAHAATRTPIIMSHSQEPSVADDELKPSQTAGYSVGEKKSVQEYQQLDANDESLNRWKASLGLGGASGAADPSKPKVSWGGARSFLQAG